ncbi:MAG TPA: zf-HC2 domain-containing protein [Chloroflexota bacterium]|nr:zf-HC2 domain-containing protein [Chloroflexota bacterium]
MNTIERTCAARYDEGLLKALVDGQLSPALRDELREHASHCRACSDRIQQLRMDGALVTGRLQLLGGAPTVGAALVSDGPPSVPRPPVSLILERARQREVPAPAWWERVVAYGQSLPSLGPIRPLPLAAGSIAAAALIAVSFTQPAVQSFAQGIVQSLRVQRVEPIKIDPAVLRGLPIGDPADVARVGTYRGPSEPRIRASSVAEASRTTGLALRAPGTLPAAIRNTQTIYVSEAETFSVTYDGQKLVQVAQEVGIRDAALLNDLRALNGVTVRGSVPSAAAFLWGTPPYAGGTPTAQDARAAATRQPAGPFVAFVQMKSPTLDVPPTVNADQLRDRLLRSGALPPQLANQLLAVQDWKSTLPIPVTRGTATQVPVDGVTGTLVVGELPVPMLVWQKDGALYVLAGTLSETDLLAAARSLQPAR